MPGLSMWDQFYEIAPWWRIEEVCEIVDEISHDHTKVLGFQEAILMRAISKVFSKPDDSE